MNPMPSPPTISIQNHGPVQNQVGNQYVNGDIIINSGNETQECMISLCRDMNDPHNDRSKLIREKGKRTKGTCEWIKSNTAYSSWEQNRKSQVLWISGGPGKGKTMLSIYLTEELNPRQSDSHLLAYFFCSNQDESRNTIMGILRGLLWQILRDRDSVIDHLLSEYKMKKEALFHDPSSSDSLWRIFKSIVCDSRLGTVFCIIDGLDECNEFSIKFFLMELREWFEVELRDSPRATFKLAVISRDLPNWLKNKLSDFPHINLNPDHKSQVGSDIEKFIANKVDELSVDLECSPELKEKIRQAFIQGSQGTFLWVGLVAKDLSEMDVSEVEAALDLLPKHLPGIYARMLREIQQNRREIASSVLRWVVTALRPLTLTELATAMNVQETNAIPREQKIKGYVRFCGSILKVTDNEVGLVHQSAKDYLQRQQPDEDDVLEWFRIKRDEANLTLTRYCFEYIHQPLESGPVNLKLDHSIYSRDFPMLNYAVVSWPEHARLSPESVADIFDICGPFCRNGSKLFEHWWMSYRQSRGTDKAPRLFSLLHMASYFGIIPLAKRILHDPASKENLGLQNAVDVKDTEDRTPLFYAVYSSQKDMVRLLLENGADVNACGRWLAHPIIALEWAAEKGLDEIARLLLLKHKAAEESLKEMARSLRSAAAKKGLQDISRLVLNGRADHCLSLKNRANHHVCNALGLALQHGHLSVVELLLDAGLDDVNAESYLGAGFGPTALFFACRTKYLSAVQLLLNRGANPNIVWWKWEEDRPLHHAVAATNPAMAKALPARNANVDMAMTWTNDCKGTALHVAIQMTREDMARALLASGASTELVDQFGRTPLHLAVRCVRKRPGTEAEEIVALLLEYKANVDVPCHLCLGESTALHIAAEWATPQLVRTLLHRNANVNAEKSGYWEGETALHIAARDGTSWLVQELLDAGASINAVMRTMQGGTALILAAENGHLSTVQLLLNQQADWTVRRGEDGSGDSALQVAATNGHLDVVNLLLKHIGDAADAEAREFLATAMLTKAVLEGDAALVRSLLQSGANVKTRNKRASISYYQFEREVEETALHVAAREGYNSIAQLLLESGADVNAWSAGKKIGEFLDTPLHQACLKGQKEIVELLLNRGADIEAKAKDAYDPRHRPTPLFFAVLSKSEEVVRILLQRGADVNATTTGYWGQTALIVAAWTRCVTIARLLLDYGASINAVCDIGNGATALYIATENGDISMVKMLLDRGAKVIVVADYRKISALRIAAESNRIELAEMFLDEEMAVADVEEAMHIACEKGRVEVARTILRKAPNITLMWERKTALQTAEWNGHEEIAKLLRVFLQSRARNIRL